ncbi:M1 family aminopeptidase [Pontibacter fetidus]|uniref:Aminopeptidase N n=1 Tax=Pontibacter fetidus TaxID=2700082 RepID=A0A6B2H7X7_9BACT|nr:M1 family aminopeptidase [Pontibacter fetidus]NDK56080.1 T9SS type A sorting domain-containing protein [Pontibacter fetidus]
MKKAFLLLLLWAGMLPCVKAQLLADVTCANSRTSSIARQAVTTPQHLQLMNMYDVTFYALDLALECNSVYISGSVTTHATIKGKPLTVFAFELHPNFTIESVTINGIAQTSIARNNSDVAVTLTSAVAANGTLKAVIKYSGSAPQSNNAAIGNGFNTAIENQWKNNVTWSLSEPYAAYEWWPTKQVLTDKADSVHVSVTTSPENKAGSNGLLTKTETLPNGKVRYHWKSKYPVAYYLISVAVSDYEEYVQFANPAGAAKPIPIVNYVYKGGALNLYKPSINQTAPLLELYSQLFTLYPFAKEKYGHSMAPIGGGMEHQTMTTLDNFNFTLVAHELAHQWFGDNVTCASWQDIWLNESFASYAEYLALENLYPEAASGWMNDAHSRAMRALQGSLRVPDTTNVNRIFNYNITYKKGAAVVHMLRYEIANDARFFEALRNYQTQYRGRTATTADMQRVFEEATGKDLDYFFKQWYEGEGFPDFRIQWNQEGENVVLEATQTTTGKTPFFKTDVTYSIQTTAGTETYRVTQNTPKQQFVFKVTGDVTNLEVDPQNWILNNVSQLSRNNSLKVPQLAPMLYPNPVSANTITIADLPFGATSAIVYDRVGRRVGTFQLSSQQQVVLPIHHLPAGLYVVHFTDGKQSYKARFVKL